jgi:hypothetical protein
MQVWERHETREEVDVMAWLRTVGRLLPLGLTAAVLAFACQAGADEIKGVGRFQSDAQTVELFRGIENGQLEARLIVKDSTECRVFVANKSGKPLNVAMPAAFAGVPVLAQLQQPWNPIGFNQNNNQPQGIGIGNQFGANPGQPFMNARGGGGNMNMFAPFNIAPEKVGTLRLTAVCLEHGKPEPRPRMAYQLKPINEVTDRPEVTELCGMVGRGEVSQRAAQAAAWHLNNDMSWEGLRALRVKIALGRFSRPFFDPQELSEGKLAAERAIELAQEKEKAGKRPSLARR